MNPRTTKQRHLRARLACFVEPLEPRLLLTTAPVGDQFLVSDAAGFAGSPPVIAVDGGGGYVAAWESFEGDGSSFGVLARRFDANGVALAPTFSVNTFKTGEQSAPVVVSDATGNSLVVWQSKDQDGSGYGVYAQWYDSNGAPNGLEFRLNTTTAGDQRAPAAAIDNLGRVVVAWQSADQDGDGWGVYYARLSSVGDTIVDEELLAADSTAGEQQAPTVAASSNGTFVIAWEATDPLGGAEASLDVYAKRFDSTTGVELGDEFKINTQGLRDQVAPQAAIDANGNFAVVWVSEGIPGSGSDVFGQRFNASGIAAGAEFRVNDTTLASQVGGSIAMDALGNFLVTWQSVHQDGFSWGVFGREYAASGATIKSEFLVNTQVEGPQTAPSVATNSTGRTVVAWLGKDDTHAPAVYAQRFQRPMAGASVAMGSEMQLGNFAEFEGSAPAAAMDLLGNSIVVWENYEQDGSGLGVYGQRLDTFGDPLGDPFLVNVEAVDGNQSSPAVARATDGAFVVVWQSDDLLSDGYDIYAQRYDAEGSLLAPPILVNDTHTELDQTNPAVAMGEDGRFVVVWQGVSADGTNDIFGQRFDGAGNKVDGEFRVNDFDALEQVMPVVAMNALGQFAVAWVSSHPAAAGEEDEEAVDAEKSIFVQWYDQNGVHAGPEVIAHNYVNEAQESPSIGIDAAGNVVVAWQSINQDGSTWGVYGRQLRPDKVPVQADEFLVNETTEGSQRLSGVGVDADGSFVIAWENNTPGLADGSSWDIYRREYFPDGSSDGHENVVNTWNGGPQTLPVVARSAAGNYGIFWAGQGFSHVDGVHGRLYDVTLSNDPGTPSRIPVGDQFLVGATLGFENSSPAIAVHPLGTLTLAYETFEEDGSGFGIFAQRYDAAGNPIADSLVQVNTTTQDDQSAPAIASDGTGRVLIVWQSKDADGYGIFGQWFDAAGEKLDSGEFRVNATQAGDQRSPDVALDEAGRAIVAWQSWSATTGWDVKYARLEPLGVPSGGSQDLSAHVESTGDQLAVSVASAATDGQFVIAWQGPGVAEEDEEASMEIFARRYDVTGAALGNEFQVNGEPVPEQNQGGQTSKKDQVLPDVAMAANGDAVFVWQVEGISGSGSDVYGRRMDASGSLLGDGDFRVNTTTSKPQRVPSVSMDEHGNFLVAWQSQHQDGFSWGIYGHEYLANGDTVEDEFAINEQVAGPQTSPGVAANAAGRTLVAWLGNDTTHLPTVFGHLYQLPSAEPDFSVGAELRLVNYRGIEETPPAAAMNARRESVVAWESYAEDGSGLGVFAQMLGDHGQPLGERWTVNSFTVGNQGAPAVARAPLGQFVIVWESEGLDGEGYGIYGQRYASDGTPLDLNFQVNTTGLRDQTNPKVAMAADGSFVVTWESVSDDVDNSLDIKARRYAANGLAIGSEVLVNQFDALDQKSPTTAMNAAGQYVIAWVSDHPAVSDPNDSEKSVFVQWYGANGQSIGPEVLVHRYVKDAQEAPGVGIDANGRFVVGWQSINQDGNSWGVFARTFGANKVPVERREFVVNETRLGPQRYVGVGMDDVGRFVISWQSNSKADLAGGMAPLAASGEGGEEGGGHGGGSVEGSSWDVYSRQYSFDGHREGGEIAVNTWAMGPQIRPVIAQAPGGDFGIFWLGQAPDHVEGVNGRLYQSLFDMGDAPDPVGATPGRYPTLLANNGARHAPGSTLFLGARIDMELEGQPNATATGDDVALSDDEDGVVIPAVLLQRLTSTITVTASAAGKLDAWIDFDRDGVFEATESIATSLPVTAGINTVSFEIPDSAVGGTTYARFRVSSIGGLAPTGMAGDGEVEDYQVVVQTLPLSSANVIDDFRYPGQKVLVVVGTNANDVLVIEPRPLNRLQVRIQNTGRTLGIFPFASFSRIMAFGLAGHDQIRIDTRINKPSEIYGNTGNDTLRGGSGQDLLFGGDGLDRLYGNAGNDTLWGGADNDYLNGGANDDFLYGEGGADQLYGDIGNDVLLGGADNDYLHGGRGRDLLIGGGGADRLYGREFDDILVGASTIHDSNDVALLAIMNEWKSTRPFATRIANLASLLNTSTVLNDGVRDELWGGTNRDWMIDYEQLDAFADLSTNLTTGDRKN